jgi:RHS repeat-associated protein
MENTYVFDAWGATRSSTETFAQPFRYTGREVGDAADSLFYRARYYEPLIGRFLSEDPFGFETDENFYRYVANDPISNVDPSGLVLMICSRPLSGAAGKFAGPGSVRRHVFLYSSNAKTGCGLGPKNALPGALTSVTKLSVAGAWEYDNPYDSKGRLKPGFQCQTVSNNPLLETCAIGQCSGTPPKYSGCGGRSCFDWAEQAIQKCQCQTGTNRAK